MSTEGTIAIFGPGMAALPSVCNRGYPSQGTADTARLSRFRARVYNPTRAAADIRCSPATSRPAALKTMGRVGGAAQATARSGRPGLGQYPAGCSKKAGRSEEHTSELQSPCNLVCRLLLEKKKKTHIQCVLTQLHITRTTTC